MPEKKVISKLIRIFFIVGFFSFLLFLNPKGIFSPVRNFFLTLAYPFQKSFYFLGRQTKDGMGFLGSISELKNENEKLIRENNRLAAENSRLQEEKRENEILREQLRLAPRGDFNLESAFVIGQDNQKLGNWIMIDKGSLDGIESGMSVIVSDGILVGRVDEVNLKNSKVNLLSGSSSSVNVIDLETGAKGIVRGEYGLGLMIDMVAQTESLNEGDSIVTSGLGGRIPKGLLVGKVRDLRNSSDGLYQQALVIPRVKYSSLEVVFIIKQ